MPTRAEFEEKKHKRSSLGTFAEKPAEPKARISLAPGAADPVTTAPTAPVRKLEEDEVPTTTPDGAKIVDYADGVAHYSDGSSYSAEGWKDSGLDVSYEGTDTVTEEQVSGRAATAKYGAKRRQAEQARAAVERAAIARERARRIEARRKQLRDRSAKQHGEPLDATYANFYGQFDKEGIKRLKDKYLWTVQDNSIEQNLVLARRLGWPTGKGKDGHTFIVTPWGTRYRGNKPKKPKKAKKARAKKKAKPQGFWHGFTSSGQSDDVAELRVRVHGVVASSLRARVHGSIALTASPFNLDELHVGAWDELLHPRGRDGKFIEKFGWVRGRFVIPGVGTFNTDRAQVVGFAKNTQSPDDPFVVVQKGGDRGYGLASSTQQVSGPKGRLADEVVGRDGEPISVGQKVELAGMHGFQHGQRGKYEVEGEVAEILDGVVVVKVTDSRWEPGKFGETFDAAPSQVAQAGYKGKSKGKAPKQPSSVPKPKPPAVAKEDTGKAPPRTELVGYKPDPEGPGFAPLEVPSDWFDQKPTERLSWLKETMEADFSEWRGKPTVIDFTGYDSGIALNLANTYRELANWDPGTARRIDKFIPGAMDDSEGGGLGSSAIAVAHPGTAHPGGIGPKIKDSAIVLKESYFASMGKWHTHHGGGMPWSMSEMSGDPTLTLVHEFAHQRQFRFLDISMREVGAAWSPVVRDDGFGLVPDSSNWPITQELRYKIPKLTPTQYGHSKTSEGFAEAWAARSTGDASPELISVLDEWDAYMGLTLMLPPKRYEESTVYDLLSPADQDKFWQESGPMLDLPGMRDHYPESAAAYDQWLAGSQQPGWVDAKGEIGYTENDDDWSDVVV